MKAVVMAVLTAVMGLSVGLSLVSFLVWLER